MSYPALWKGYSKNHDLKNVQEYHIYEESRTNSSPFLKFLLINQILPLKINFFLISLETRKTCWIAMCYLFYIAVNDEQATRKSSRK